MKGLIKSYIYSRKAQKASIFINKKIIAMKTRLLIPTIVGVNLLNLLLLGSCTGNISSNVGDSYYPLTHSSVLTSSAFPSKIDLPNSFSAAPDVLKSTPLSTALSSHFSPAIETLNPNNNPLFFNSQSDTHSKGLMSMQSVYSPIESASLSGLSNITTIAQITSSNHSVYSDLKTITSSEMPSPTVSHQPQDQVFEKTVKLLPKEGFKASLLDKTLMKVEKRGILPSRQSYNILKDTNSSDNF